MRMVQDFVDLVAVDRTHLTGALGLQLKSNSPRDPNTPCLGRLSFDLHLLTITSLG